MAFKKIIPRARSSSGDVKVSFTGSKTIYANVYFSFELLENLGWDKDCRVCVYYDDENPKKWMIEKSINDDGQSFRLASSKNKKVFVSKLQFKFAECVSILKNRKLRVVNFEVEEGNVLIMN
ncbi:hypothetical protein UFOVP459_56 [uncultured Caudovirales phage]|uniref:Uncharacterized protein n=1 Tax=uncultured Caudovirales phage TaxID=2100421 RepID=A0A6J5SFY0_9CAUD|nr:hypothetical protein UFOVP459_56 [uncultured Caudovirales phage]CAB4182931.1 hypothetical protein UFOVP1089_29 [uncultured Caudovirales phage]CAB4212927.1 hypothetical protein UFOVP1443_48 [uncultured Caudovirales phage]